MVVVVVVVDVFLVVVVVGAGPGAPSTEPCPSELLRPVERHQVSRAVRRGGGGGGGCGCCGWGWCRGLPQRNPALLDGFDQWSAIRLFIYLCIYLLEAYSPVNPHRVT